KNAAAIRKNGAGTKILEDLRIDPPTFSTNPRRPPRWRTRYSSRSQCARMQIDDGYEPSASSYYDRSLDRGMAMAMPASLELSFVYDIKPLFGDEDQNNMLGFGLDLSGSQRVCAAAGPHSVVAQ